MSQQSNSSSAIGLPTLLLVLFIGLKLGKVINWPWVWVLSPYWIPLSIAGIVLFILLVAYLVVCLVEHFGDK